jgi:hypothetical protein
MFDRVTRARRIAAMRAQEPPIAWRSIATQVGLSESQARDVYADFLRWQEGIEDPMRFVDETIDSLTVAMSEAADAAAHADKGSTARVGAIRTFVDVAEMRLALMQRAGKVPRYLGAFAAQEETRVIFEEFAALLKRHDVKGAVLDDFVGLARRMAQRHRGELPVEGTATAA